MTRQARCQATLEFVARLQRAAALVVERRLGQRPGQPPRAGPVERRLGRGSRGPREVDVRLKQAVEPPRFILHPGTVERQHRGAVLQQLLLTLRHHPAVLVHDLRSKLHRHLPCL